MRACVVVCVRACVRVSAFRVSGSRVSDYKGILLFGNDIRATLFRKPPFRVWGLGFRTRKHPYKDALNSLVPAPLQAKFSEFPLVVKDKRRQTECVVQRCEIDLAARTLRTQLER